MLRLEDVSIRADGFALERVNLRLPTGSYGVLMGATGAGKTTLLEVICGLRALHAGRIWSADREITDAPIERRGVGYVPQDGAVFPRMTVRENLAFPLLVRGVGRREINAQTDPLAERLGIAHLLGRRAAGLSGGESQRVAIGRALASKPGLLLLDEPLSALDEATREEMTSLLNSVQSETRVTTLHVTHNRGEALRLADHLFVIADARLTRDEQAPPPDPGAVVVTKRAP